MLFVGVDFGARRHAVAVAQETGRFLVQREVEHDGVGISEFCAELRELAGGQEVWVGIEKPRGPLIDLLRGFGFRVFAVNPKQIDAWRRFATASEAKDDRRDAQAIADALRCKPEGFCEVQDAEHSELRTLLSLRAATTKVRVAASNRVSTALLPVLPNLMKLVSLERHWSQRLLRRVVEVEQPWMLRSTIKTAMKGARKTDAATVREALKADSHTCTEESWPGARLVARLALEHLQLAVRQLAEIDARVAALVDTWLAEADESVREDVELIRSMPASGGQLIPVLLAHAWGAIEGRDRERLRRLGGIAPVTRQTGGKRKPGSSEVKQRRACDGRLRETLHHWGRTAAQNDERAAARLEELEKRGHTHGRAIRQLVDGLLRVAFSCLASREPYRPDFARKAA